MMSSLHLFCSNKPDGVLELSGDAVLSLSSAAVVLDSHSWGLKPSSQKQLSDTQTYPLLPALVSSCNSTHCSQCPQSQAQTEPRVGLSLTQQD